MFLTKIAYPACATGVLDFRQGESCSARFGVSFELEDAMRSAAESPCPIPQRSSFLDAICSRVNDYLTAARLRRELDRFGAARIAQIASDVGIDTQDLVSFVEAGPHAVDQLPKLLHALGADSLVSGNPVIMRDLQRGCIMCAHKTQCDHDLAAGATVRNYRSYCANAMSLDALVKAN